MEAIDRFTFDARCRHACGVGGWDHGLVEFDRTVLVRFRMRLADSHDPRRIFARTTQIAAEAGLVGVKRVLDSAPPFDAVATMDTVTLVRSAIRGLLKTADTDLEHELRAVLSGDDEYRSAGKPACDWRDADARTALIDSLARDGMALLATLEGRDLPDDVIDAAQLLATVIGQDLQADEQGVFRIVRGVATDRVISTVDPQARHGRKSTSGKSDGYMGHIAVDPDSELEGSTPTWWELRASPLGGEDGGAIVTHTDVTWRHQAQEKLYTQAHTDQLAGLVNRAGLYVYAQAALARARRTGVPVTGMFLDVDRFKPINDTYGHEAGDRLLATLAARLSQVTRETDCVARVGGDEFVIVCETLGSAGAEAFTKRIRHALSQPVDIGPVVSVEVSIGAVTVDGDADLDQALADADQRMYQAKHDWTTDAQ